MRNPNGYGTVVKLSGNRRRPYAVRKTAGFNEKGYPVYKNIGYAETKAEGLMILAEYNRNPYDIDLHKITVEEVYKNGLKETFQKCLNRLFALLKEHGSIVKLFTKLSIGN